MSVTTKADERLEDAMDHINEAQKAIMEVLDPDTWGHDEYKPEFIDELTLVLFDILKLKRKMKGES